MPLRDEPIVIPVNGQEIDGTIVTSDTRLPAVLFVHGWGGDQSQYLSRAREIAALGCRCLTFDLRGHARTKPQYDTVSRSDNLDDVLAAYDALAGYRGVDRSAIALVGSSYGGYLAAIATTLRPVRWLALRAPALYLDEGWELPKRQLNKDPQLRAYRRRLVAPEENRALRACLSFEGDVLIVASENDNIIPPPTTASYREACLNAHSLTSRVISGADHGLSEVVAQQAYTSLLVNWLTEMFTGLRGGGREAQSRVKPVPERAVAKPA
jgi:uncharacterized protein